MTPGAGSRPATGSSTIWSAAVKEAEHAIVLSADGLLMASSAALHADRRRAPGGGGLRAAEPGQGRPEQFGGGPVRQTIVEMESAFLHRDRGGRAAPAWRCSAREDADVGLVAYEMAMLVARVGQYLTSRGPAAGADAVNGDLTRSVGRARAASTGSIRRSSGRT